MRSGLTAFYTGDFGRARDLVAETFAFRGPFLQAEGRDAFDTARFRALLPA
jgi:hypothetical protein